MGFPPRPRPPSGPDRPDYGSVREGAQIPEHPADAGESSKELRPRSRPRNPEAARGLCRGGGAGMYSHCARGNRLPLSPDPSLWPPDRDLIHALARELTQPLLCALLLPGPQWQSPSPSPPGSRVKGACSKVKARPAATWGFFPAEHELCNRIVKDHGSGRKSERPHRSARGRIYFTARNTLRQTQDFRGRGCRVSGRWNVAKTKHSPPKHTTTPRLREEGSSGPLCPRL